MNFSIYHVDYDALRGCLKGLRLKAGLTQEGMSERLGVGQSYVSKLERGENFVDVLLYVRWCEVCGVKPGVELDKLLSGSPNLDSAK